MSQTWPWGIFNPWLDTALESYICVVCGLRACLASQDNAPSNTESPSVLPPTCLALHSSPLRSSLLPVSNGQRAFLSGPGWPVVWLVTRSWQWRKVSFQYSECSSPALCFSGHGSSLKDGHPGYKQAGTLLCHGVPSALKDAYHGSPWTSVYLCGLPCSTGMQTLGKAQPLCSPSGWLHQFARLISYLIELTVFHLFRSQHLLSFLCSGKPGLPWQSLIAISNFSWAVTGIGNK